MFTLSNAWLIIWITAIVVFTMAMIVLVLVGLWFGVRRLWAEIAWQMVLRRSKRP